LITVSNPKIRLFFREPHIDTNEPLFRGSVGVPGFDVVLADSQADADAWDCAFGGRLASFEAGPRLVSIPAFSNRKFRLSYIFVNNASGIAEPSDLRGKRVGIRFWSNTAGVWARGALMHHFNVGLEEVRWVAGARDRTPFPAELEISYLDERFGRPLDSRDLEVLLVDGEIDALIDANVPASVTRRDPRVRRLFENYPEVERNYYRTTSIFPISHLVTLRSAFVEAHPEAPRALLRAYRKARDTAFNAIEGADPRVLVLPWMSHLLQELRELMGPNYFSYDVANNRVTIDAMLRFAHEQWLTSRLIRAEEIFAADCFDDFDQML
jgi:4,5-dihydroxyphthalate decarboxylase